MVYSCKNCECPKTGKGCEHQEEAGFEFKWPRQIHKLYSKTVALKKGQKITNAWQITFYAASQTGVVPMEQTVEQNDNEN